MLNHSEFEFIGGSKSLEPVEYRIKVIERVLTTMEVVERSIPVVSEFVDIFPEEY